MSCLGISLQPRPFVRLEQRLEVIAQAFAYLHHRGHLIPTRNDAARILVERPGHLIEVAAKGAELGDGALEREELILRYWRYAMEMGADEECHVRC